MPEKNDDEKDYPISLKIDINLIDRMEYDWRAKQYRNRTTYVFDAFNRFIEGIRCPSCGALNPKGGHICSVCLSPLPTEKNLNVKITQKSTDTRVDKNKESKTEKKVPKKRGRPAKNQKLLL